MKKFIGLSVLFLSFLLVSCGNHSYHKVSRIKANLDLTYVEKDSNYQYSWSVLKNLNDETDVFNQFDNIYIKLKGTPEQNLPEIKGYFAENKDPQLISREDFENSKEENSEYIAMAKEWVPVTDEFTLFDSATGMEEFAEEIALTLNYDILDNKNVILFFYLDPDALPEDYFDYYDALLKEAEEKAWKMAEEKAEKQNKKNNLTESDVGYHKPEEYYEKFYNVLLEEIGEKRIIINDVTLHLEIINN